MHAGAKRGFAMPRSWSPSFSWTPTLNSGRIASIHNCWDISLVQACLLEPVTCQTWETGRTHLYLNPRGLQTLGYHLYSGFVQLYYHSLSKEQSLHPVRNTNKQITTLVSGNVVGFLVFFPLFNAVNCRDTAENALNPHPSEDKSFMPAWAT